MNQLGEVWGATDKDKKSDNRIETDLESYFRGVRLGQLHIMQEIEKFFLTTGGHLTVEQSAKLLKCSELEMDAIVLQDLEFFSPLGSSCDRLPEIHRTFRRLMEKWHQVTT